MPLVIRAYLLPKLRHYKHCIPPYNARSTTRTSVAQFVKCVTRHTLCLAQCMVLTPGLGVQTQVVPYILLLFLFYSLVIVTELSAYIYEHDIRMN